MYKLRADYYMAQNELDIQMATEVVCFDVETPGVNNGRAAGRDSPLILIDSGSSRSVCGRKLVEWRFHSAKIELESSKKNFIPGASHAMKILGMVAISIRADAEPTDSKTTAILPVRVDVVDSDVHVLISHESLC